MVNDNIRTLLLVTSSGTDALFPFLFEFTKFWATQGRQLLYISKSKIESLPPSLGKIERPDPEILKLMQFMYLPGWKDLLYQLATISIRRFQVCAIVVDNLVNYFEDRPEHKTLEEHASCICANLLFAILMASRNALKPVALVCGYVSKDSTIEQNIIKNFFHNVWEVKSEDKLLRLLKRSEAKKNELISFTYNKESNNLSFDNDHSNKKLELVEIVKKIIAD